MSDGTIRFLSDEQALTFQAINSLRDAVQHHYLNISEEHLYLHAQGGLTLFKDLLKKVFDRDLADELPDRVLPIATKVPTDIVMLFEREVEEIRKLLSPGKRRRTEAYAKLRSLAIVDNSLGGEKLQPGESDLRKLERKIRSKESWENIFPAVAAINIVTDGQGLSLSIRITKKEGIPVQVVPEGTPGATVVAVKRVNELDYYNLSGKQTGEHVGLTLPKTVAVISHLQLKGNLDFHKQITIGKAKFHRYSQKVIPEIKKVLESTSIDDIWKEYQESSVSSTL